MQERLLDEPSNTLMNTLYRLDEMRWWRSRLANGSFDIGILPHFKGALGQLRCAAVFAQQRTTYMSP
jgi:hypothetical protein